MPPPKPPLTAVSKPDPIYPYLPFLFCLLFGNDRAICDIWTTRVAFAKDSGVKKLKSLFANGHKSHEVVHLPYKPYRTVARISLGLWKRFDELVDFSGGVVQVGGDAKAITAWRGDDILRVEVVIQGHRRTL